MGAEGAEDLVLVANVESNLKARAVSREFNILYTSLSGEKSGRP